MIIFFLFATLLIVLTLLCAFSVWNKNQNPAAHADEAEWQVLRAKRSEIDADVLMEQDTRQVLRREWQAMADSVLSRRQGAAAGIALPAGKWIAGITGAIAIVLYALVGRWDAEALKKNSPEPLPVAGTQRDLPPADNARHPGSSETIEERVAKLEKRLQSAPGDIEGWVLLSRSRAIQRDFAGSAAALEKALALAPGHPDILADLADVTAMNNNKSLAGRPLQLIREALKSDPEHQKALSLAATAAMQAQDIPTATEYWKRLRATFPAGSPDIAQVDAILASLGNAPAAPANPVATRAAAAAAASGAAIEGEVVLSPALRQSLSKQALPANATLFVVAKSPSGPPMPIAVERLAPGALAGGQTLSFKLDDSKAMSPSFKLSDQREVNLEARISLSGTASRQSGDLYGVLAGVKPGGQKLKLTIESTVP